VRFYLAENVVLVNGEPEQRRGRKLRAGDVVVAPGAEPIRLVEGERDL
jgi:ribosome-associated protein